MASSSSSTTTSYDELPLCKCKTKAKMSTGWKRDNPGRRFLACKKWPDAECCNFFEWYDPEMCKRSKAIIPGLLRNMNEKEEHIAELERRMRRMKVENETLERRVRDMQEENEILRKKMDIPIHLAEVQKWRFRCVIVGLLVLVATMTLMGK